AAPPRPGRGRRPSSKTAPDLAAAVRHYLLASVRADNRDEALFPLRAITSHRGATMFKNADLSLPYRIRSRHCSFGVPCSRLLLLRLLPLTRFGSGLGFPERIFQQPHLRKCHAVQIVLEALGRDPDAQLSQYLVAYRRHELGSLSPGHLLADILRSSHH